MAIVTGGYPRKCCECLEMNNCTKGTIVGNSEILNYRSCKHLSRIFHQGHMADKTGKISVIVVIIVIFRAVNILLYLQFKFTIFHCHVLLGMGLTDSTVEGLDKSHSNFKKKSLLIVGEHFKIRIDYVQWVFPYPHI